MEIFHLAIPTDSLEKSKEFYKEIFLAEIGREYEDYVVFNFFGHQLVTHLCPEEISEKVQMYPRHLGVILTNKDSFNALYDNCKKKNARFFEDLFERFKEKPGWHLSFFIVDPSNNLIEIKHYINSFDIFSKK